MLLVLYQILDLFGSQVLMLRTTWTQAAYDKQGRPTKALEGFCAKNGVSVDAVEQQADAKGTEYIFAICREAGKPAVEVLALSPTLQHHPPLCGNAKKCFTSSRC